MHAPLTPPLTEDTLIAAVAVLAECDADLQRVVQRIGPPPLWARPPGFATLVYIILEQQVSLASARAAFTRLAARLGGITAHTFLALDDDTLKQIGFSRQKAAYARALAQALLAGELDLAALEDQPDDVVRAGLTRLKGIGRWSADIYLMEALLRPDIWPHGDLALAIAVQKVKGLAKRPTPGELEVIGEAYQPWRAVAARLYWHDYLTPP